MRASSSRSTSRVAAVAGSLLLAAACVGQLPDPTDAHVAAASAQWPGTTRAQLVEGRRLYVNRCSGCHSLVLPSALAAGSWPSAVDEMAERSQLSPEEAATVTRYLVAASEVGAR